MSRIISLYKTRVGINPLALQLLKQLKPDYPKLKLVRMENVLRLEYEDGVEPDMNRLAHLFCYPGAEQVTAEPAISEINLVTNEWESGDGCGPNFVTEKGEVIEVSYQRAWTDPEMSSVFHAAEALGVREGLIWVRLAMRYKFVGINRKTAEEIAVRYLYNSKSQIIIKPGEVWDNLRPRGEHQPLRSFNVADMSLDDLAVLSDERRLFLHLAQWAVLRDFFRSQGRPARDAEIEMIAAYWGDHCSHTTWKSLGLLQDLQFATRQINHPLVISSYEDNSGVMKLYGGWAICGKGETHISPSAVDPYGGIMTKHDGVQRDPMGTGLGAWPIIGTTIMATQDPRMLWEKVRYGTLHPLITVREAIRGTKDQTNPMGIPMGWSQYLIHPRNVKSFALGHSVGILPAKKAKKGIPRVGDYVVLIGGLTGNDGLHGATVSSGATTSKTMEVDAAHVQIAMPIEQRIFMEVIPKLRDAGCLRFITDNGAAGLSCSVGESGSLVKKLKELTSGVWINLAWVPLKCVGMPPWAILLSESQERMTLAVIPSKLGLAMEILADHGCRATIIGVYTDSEDFQVIYDPEIDNQAWIQNPQPVMSGEVVVGMPYSFITKDCPLPKFTLKEPAKPKAFKAPVPRNETQWIELLQKLLGHYNICDQSFAAHQYDQTVQGGTVISYLAGINERMPEEIFAHTPVEDKPYTAGIANAINQLYGEIDAAVLGRLVYAQAVTKLVAAGFGPGDITTICNVYTPPAENPEHAWRLSKLVKDGYAPASVILGVPVISGKDSSSGRFTTDTGEHIDAPLTFDVLAMGRMPHWCRLIPKAFAKPGDAIVLYTPGLKKIGLGGSLLNNLYGEIGNDLSKVNLRELRAGWADYHLMLKQLRWSRSVHSRSVVAEGGLIRRLFEMSLGSGLGCQIQLNLAAAGPLDWLCGELNSGIIFTAGSQSWRKYLAPGDCQVIGLVVGEPVISVGSQGKKLFQCPTEVLAEKWARTFEEVIS